MLEAEHIHSDVRVPRYAMFARYLEFADAQYTLLVIVETTFKVQFFGCLFAFLWIVY